MVRKETKVVYLLEGVITSVHSVAGQAAQAGVSPPQEGSSAQPLSMETPSRAKEASSEKTVPPVVNTSISHWKTRANRNHSPERSRASVPGNKKTGNKQKGLVKGRGLPPHPHVLESPWRWLTSLIMTADRGLFHLDVQIRTL